MAYIAMFAIDGSKYISKIHNVVPETGVPASPPVGRERAGNQHILLIEVPETGVEPARLLGHTDLNRARLPIPPPGHKKSVEN